MPDTVESASLADMRELVLLLRRELQEAEDRIAELLNRVKELEEGGVDDV